MGIIESIKYTLSKYAVFEGRSSRSEFWYFILFSCIVSFISVFLDNSFGTSFDLGENPITDEPNNILGYGKFYAVCALVLFLPSIAVQTRRLHDVGRSGWNYFWALTGIGSFLLIYWYCSKGDADENKYGGVAFDVSEGSAPQQKSRNGQSAPKDPFAEIERLGAMLEKGLITAEEFTDQKKRILGSK